MRWTRAPEPGHAKLGLTRWLLGRGYRREEVIGLYRFIDWLLQLPEEAERAFLAAARIYEEERQMPYITGAERIGRQDGLAEGRREGLLMGLEQILELKFGDAGRRAFEEVRRIEEVAVLQAVTERLRTATTLEEVRAMYQPQDT